MKLNTYQEALVYLDQFADYERVRTSAYTPEAFNLARLEALLARLGDPHRRYPIVHVAGSKGKGSVCAMTESVLRTAGFRTGLYTSPHLHSFCERICVNGQPVARQDVLSMVNDLIPHIEALPGLTWFEIVTAMGFWHFAQQAVQLAVVEVGLGGRLDATNVVSPLVSVITSLSLDHTAWLGDSLAQIAAEKAGIIKPGVALVSAPQPRQALEVIEQRCRELNSPLTLLGRDWNVEPGDISDDGQSFCVVPLEGRRWRGAVRQRVCFFTNLLGRHQVTNAGVALASLARLEQAGLEIAPRHMREGLANVVWPARLEILSREPLVVCDGAHNGDSADRLVAALREWFPDKRWTLICGASSDKDLGAMLDAWAPFAQLLILTRSHHPRAATLETLIGLAQARGGQVQTAVGVAEALEAALAQGDPATGVIATGSLFVAAEARAAWMLRSGQTPPETDM